MSPTPQQPQMNVVQTPDYRESYANSVQVRVSVWDFSLVFGLASSDSPDQVTIRNHQAIFLSPQQAIGDRAVRRPRRCVGAEKRIQYKDTWA